MGNNSDKEDGGGTDGGSSNNTPSNQRKASQAAGSQPGSRNPSIGGATGGVLKLTMAQKDLIRQIWDSSKRTEICVRIYKRVFDKRPDMRKVFESMGGDEAYLDEAKKFGEFMDTIVGELDDLAGIERQSLELGRRHGEWRGFGFKSDFWVVFAECMTSECVYLDAGAHQTGEVLAAWSTLITMIFGWVRDGYYDQLKMQRKLSRKASKSTVPTGGAAGPRPVSRTNSGPLPDENGGGEDQATPLVASNFIRSRPGSAQKSSPRMAERH